MNASALSVRELQASDIELIIAYWLNAEPDYLVGMGVDLGKIPGRDHWFNLLNNQLGLPYEEKKSYCMIWLIDGQPVGHCNVNNIRFGEEAYMHLHMWNPDIRQRGMGAELVKLCLPWFFKNMQLKRLFCEPYALNPAPNKTLERVGFRFVLEYIGIPGSLSFEQPVSRWELTHEDFLKMKAQG